MRLHKRARRWLKTTVMLLLLALLGNTTGCAWLCRDTCRGDSVVIDGSETITLPKATVDDLYSDIEALVQALTECSEK